jgi:hypothetical protein
MKLGSMRMTTAMFLVGSAMTVTEVMALGVGCASTEPASAEADLTRDPTAEDREPDRERRDEDTTEFDADDPRVECLEAWLVDAESEIRPERFQQINEWLAARGKDDPGEATVLLVARERRAERKQIIDDLAIPCVFCLDDGGAREARSSSSKREREGGAPPPPREGAPAERMDAPEPSACSERR